MKIKCGVQRLAFGLAMLAASASSLVAAEEKAELFEEAQDVESLVVRITGPNTDGAGILFFVDQNNAFGITAKHVLFQQGKVLENLRAEFRTLPGQRMPIEAHKFHFQEDLAVFKVDLRSLGLSAREVVRETPLDRLGASTELDPGDELFCMGHSTAGAWITPKEYVRFARRDGEVFLFEFACPQGHSGGAVFDKEGRLVGMMIDEERPYCRALRIEPILKIVQGWKLEIGLRKAPRKERGPEQASQKIVVAVVDFDNRSSKNLPKLGGVAQDITTSSLYTLPGVILVTRDRLAKVRDEVGLRDSVQTGTGLSRLGRLLNADAIVTGSILRYDVERRTFKGYGTSALQDVFRMEISLQILDVATGRVRFSKNFDVESTTEYPKETSAPREPIDRTSELLTELVNGAQKEVRSALMQMAGGLETAGQFIEVPITTQPAGADVILNGAYVGSTPYTLRVTLDMHEVKLEMPGYESWRRRIKVQPGMRIDVNLVPRR